MWDALPGWEQLTNFNDAAEIPTLSHDGKLWRFRAPAVSEFYDAAKSGSISADGEPFNSRRLL